MCKVNQRLRATFLDLKIPIIGSKVVRKQVFAEARETPSASARLKVETCMVIIIRMQSTPHTLTGFISCSVSIGTTMSGRLSYLLHHALGIRLSFPCEDEPVPQLHVALHCCSILLHTHLVSHCLSFFNNRARKNMPKPQQECFPFQVGTG